MSYEERQRALIIWAVNNLADHSGEDPETILRNLAQEVEEERLFG
jgi:hypothetical protein